MYELVYFNFDSLPDFDWAKIRLRVRALKSSMRLFNSRQGCSIEMSQSISRAMLSSFSFQKSGIKNVSSSDLSNMSRFIKFYNVQVKFIPEFELRSFVNPVIEESHASSVSKLCLQWAIRFLLTWHGQRMEFIFPYVNNEPMALIRDRSLSVIITPEQCEV